MKRFIFLIALIAIIAGGAFAYNRYRNVNKARTAVDNIKTVALAKGSLDETISAIGKVRSSQTASVVWKTSGTVDTVAGKVGEAVETGDILATLQQTSLPQNVILSQADLVNAQKALADLATQADTNKVNALKSISTLEQQAKDAKYQLDNFIVPSNMSDLSITDAVVQMKARLNQAIIDFEPYKFVSENDSQRKDLKEALDRAQSDYNTAVKRLTLEYNLEVAEANLEKAWTDFNKWKDGPDPVDIAAIQARIAAAQATLNQAWITAPFDGTITEVKQMPGDQVTPNQVAFRIDDLNHLYVDLQVSEVDISKIKPGQPATITIDALPGKEYHGQVESVGMVSTPGQNAVNFLVTVTITDPDSDLRPGMTSEVKILVDRKDDILLIPIQAVKVENGKQVVYVMNTDLSISPVEVTLGISSDTFSELTDGNLKPGDLIVLSSIPGSEADQNQNGFMFRRMGQDGAQSNTTPNAAPFGGHPTGIPGGSP